MKEKKSVNPLRRGQKSIKEFIPKEEKPRKTYNQQWSAYNLAQTQEFKLFQDLLIDLIESTIQLRKPLYKNGRPFLKLRDMLFCCVMRVYFGKSSRRNIGYLYLAKGNNYIEKVPHFNTLLNYYKKSELTTILKHLVEQSAYPLKDVEMDFAVDSSGFSTCIFSRWFNARCKKKERRLFRKAHVISGVKTNIISSVSITKGYCHDSPEFEGLVRATSKNFQVREVSGDKAYNSRKNCDVVHELGGVPYLMFRKNFSGKKKGSLIYKTMYKLYHEHRDIFLEHYHKRSNAESVFNMIKRKFGLYLYSKSEVGQTNELLCKCIAHNICVLIQELFEANTVLDFEDCKKIRITGYCADD